MSYNIDMIWINILTLVFISGVLFWMASMLYASMFHVPTVYASDQAITDAFKLAKLRSGEKVVDLGCGNAKSLIIAARDFGARGVGVENSPYCYLKSRCNVILSGQSGKIKIVFGDFKKVEKELKESDVVYMYLLNKVLAKIEPWYFDHIGEQTRSVILSFRFAHHSPTKIKKTRNLGRPTELRLY